MGKQGLNYLRFVQEHGVGIEGFGIIAETNETTGIAYVMTADMEDNFGVLEIEIANLSSLTEDEVFANLQIISENKEAYAYFIIQLNDIPELSFYHIPENDAIQHIRNTNDVLLGNAY